MHFTEVFPHIASGKFVRRASWDPKSKVRMVRPQSEAEVEGPVHAFWIRIKDRIQQQFGGFAEEEEAKAALKKARADLTRSWTAYRKNLREWEDTPVEEREGQPEAQPSTPEDALVEAQVVSVPVRRDQRINRAYMIHINKEGSVEPWQVSCSDLLASDWSIA